MIDPDRGLIEQQIESWIRREVAFPEKSHGHCSKIVLRHVNIERKADGDVRAFPVKLEGDTDEGIDPLIHAIADAAQSDANDLNSGVQTYAIYAYFPADSGFVPRKLFRVAADVEIDRQVGPSEPPTEKGLVAQSMRHLEAVLKTCVVSYGHTITTQQAEIRRLAEQNEAFAKQQVDFMVLLQDTLDNSHKRRLAERESEINVAVKEDVMAKLSALLPVVINRIAGAQIVPEEDKGFMLMAALLETMSDEQQMALYQNLSPAQRIALGEVLKMYEERKARHIDGTRKNSPFGHQNKLPPAKAKAAESKTPPQPRQIEAAGNKDEPDEEPEEILVPESKAKPVPMFMALSERLKNPTTPANPDPLLKKLEDDAAKFTSRFADLLDPSKPTTEGK